MAGLEVQCVYSWDLARVLLKVRCPQWRLEEMAEKMHMKLRRRDGVVRRFKIVQREDFASTINGTLFSSGERQQIIDRIVKSKIRDGGAELDENTALGAFIVQCFPIHKIAKLEVLRAKWVHFWRDDSPVNLTMPWSLWSTPFHVTLSRLGATARRVWRNCLSQPLDLIAEYFGENIGFLFAYTAFYTRWLVVPSLLGLVVFGFQLREKTLDHWLCLPYGVFIMIWACFMLTYWRQTQSMLAYRWGVLDFEVTETERPQFHGQKVPDEITGEERKQFPAWRRVCLYLCTTPVLLSFIAAVLLMMVTVFSTQDRLLAAYASGGHLNFSPVMDGTLGQSAPPVGTHNSTGSQPGLQFSVSVASDPTFWVIAIFYPSLYALLLYVAAYLFDLIALLLNSIENHRTESAFQNRLILKVFSFRFIAVFTSLYWYAFFPYQEPGSAYLRVAVVVFCLLTVGSWGETAMVSTTLPLLLPFSFLNRLIFNRISAFHLYTSAVQFTRCSTIFRL